MASSGKNYELLFSLKAELGSGFTSSFTQAGESLNTLGEKAQELSNSISSMEGFQNASQQVSSLSEQSYTLVSTLQSVNAEVKNAEAAQSELTAAYDEQKSAVAELEAKQKLQNEVIADYKSSMESAAASAEKLLKEYYDQRTDLNLLTQKYTEAKAKLSEYADRVAAAELDLEELTKQQKKQTSAISELNSKLEAEKAKLTEINSSLKTASSSVSSLTKKKETLNQKIAGLNEQLKGEKSRLAEVEAKLKTHSNETANLQTQKANLQKAIEKTTESLDKEQGSLNDINSRLETAQSSVQQLTQEQQEQQATVQRLTEEYNQANAELTELNSKIKAAQKELASATTAYEKQQAAVSKLEQEVEEQTAAVEKAKEAAAKAIDYSESLEIKFIDQQEALEKLNQEYTEESARLTEMGEETQQAAQKVTQLLEEKSDLEKQIKETNAELNKEYSSLQEYRAALEKAGISTDDLENKLEAYKDQLESEIESQKQATEELENFCLLADQLDAVATALSGVQTVMEMISDISGSVVDAFTECINVAGELEYEMATVGAVAGTTDDETAALTDVVQELGATTIFTASEIAEAAETAALAGWSYDDMADGLEAVTKLAAASGEDLTEMTSIVADAMNAFGLSGSDAINEFADTLTQAATSSNTTIGQMGEALSYVESTASNLGYSIQDVSTVLAVLANNSIKAGTAGAALNTMLTRMSGANESATATMEELGISLYNEAGEAYDLLTVMENLRDAFSGLDDESAQLAAYNLAGQRGMRALLSITNATEEEWQEMVEAVYDYEGATDEISDEKLDSYEGKLQLLEDAWTALEDTVGENILPIATDVVELLTEIVNWLTPLIELTGDLQVGLLAGAGTMYVMSTAISKGLQYFAKMAIAVKELSTGLQQLASTSGVTSKLYSLFSNKGGTLSLTKITAATAAISAAVAVVAGIVSYISTYISEVTSDAEDLSEELSTVQESADATNESLKAAFEEDPSNETYSEYLDELQSQYEDYNEILNEAVSEQGVLQAENASIIEAGRDSILSASTSVLDIFANQSAIEIYEDTIDETEESIEETEQAIIEAREEYLYLASAGKITMSELTEMTTEQEEALVDLTDTVDEVGDAYTTAISEAYETFSSVYSGLDEVTDETQDSYISQYGFVDDFEQEFEATGHSIVENIQSQTQAWEDYVTGLEAIKATGLDIPDDMWDTLTDGSDEAQEMVAALYDTVSDGTEPITLTNMIAAWNELTEATATAASYTATTADDLADNLESQLSAWQDYQTNMETVLSSGISYDYVSQYLDGSEESQEAMAALADAVLSNDTDTIQRINDAYAEEQATMIDMATYLVSFDEDYQASLASLQEEIQEQAAEGIDFSTAYTLAYEELSSAISNVEDTDLQETLQNNIDDILGSLEWDWSEFGFENEDALTAAMEDLNIELGGTETNEEASSAGEEMAENYIEGAAEMLSDPDSQIADAANSLALDALVGTVNEALEIESPSGVARDQAIYYIEGFAWGITDYTDRATGVMETLGLAIANTFDEALGESSGLTSLQAILSDTTSIDPSGMYEQGYLYVSYFVQGITDAQGTAEGAMTTFGMAAINSFISGAESRESAAISAMSDIASNARAAFHSALAYSKFYSYGSYAIQGAINGAESMRSSLIAEYTSLATAASEAYADAIEEGSPSKVFAVHGVYSVEGIEVGTEEEKKNLLDLYSNLGALTTSAYSSANMLESGNLPEAASYTTTTATSEVIQLNYSPTITVSGSSETAASSVRTQVASHDDELIAKLDRYLKQREHSNRRRVL